MADYKAGALSKDKKDEKEKKGDKDNEGKEKSHSSHDSGDSGGHSGGGSHRHPHMLIHSHDAGHSMHVMHDDGSHEIHHFAPGDRAGIQQVMAAHMAGGMPDMAGGGAPGAPPQPEPSAPPAPQPEPQEQAA